MEITKVAVPQLTQLMFSKLSIHYANCRDGQYCKLRGQSCLKQS